MTRRDSQVLRETKRRLRELNRTRRRLNMTILSTSRHSRSPMRYAATLYDL